MTRNGTFRRVFGAGLALLMAALALSVIGCSGSFHNNFFNGDTGTFYGADQPVGNGVARDFVELNNGIPVRLGMEFTPAALRGLPNLAPDDVTGAFLAPLPSKTHGTPLTYSLVGYVSSHPATAEPAHFHLAILIRPLLVTEPPFSKELAPVAPNEVPEGHIRAINVANPNGILVGGAGVIYDDPTEPAGAPSATTIGENYLFFEGHMNGLVIGHTIAFMLSKQLFSQPIKQPRVYPREGFYPTRWKVRFDATRNVHIIELTDFKIARNIVPPGS